MLCLVGKTLPVPDGDRVGSRRGWKPTLRSPAMAEREALEIETTEPIGARFKGPAIEDGNMWVTRR